MYTIGKKNLQDDTTWRGVPSGGFFTMIGGAQTLTIKNLTFDDARVDNYNGQLGVLAGIVYNATVNIENVHVINSTVDGGTSHKVGGLIGRVGMMERTAEHNPAIEKVTVSNCSVENTTITGMRNMAGLVGIVFSSYGVHIYNTWKDKNGQTLLAGFRAFEGQTTSQIVTWLSDCVSYMQSIVDGKTENNTGLSTSELNAKISEYQGDITGFGIDMVVTFDKSYVTNCTFISLIARTEKDASGSIKDQTNVATLYNFDDADVWYLNYDVKSFYQDDVYDNTNTIINLRVWNTQEELDGTIANPVSISKASYIEQMMKDFYTAEGNMDATEVAGYLNKTFVVTTVIDCTSIFEGNAEASSIVLPEGMKIVLAPGAKLIGIPESVLANVKIVNWCGIVTEPDTNQLLK